MIAYRIAKKIYLSDLSGTGARINGGRWNQIGLPLVYTSSHLSLAALELLANQVRNLIDTTYGYIKISIPDDQVKHLSPDSLDSKWRLSPYHESTIQLGSDWIINQESLALAVPSAVLKQESNILINPMHSNYDTLVMLGTGDLQLDGRVV